MKRKIPLAWLQLTREKTRLLVALGGIAFADILMFMQIGFKDALFEGNVRFHQNLQADIVLINPRSNALVLMRTFPKRRLYQALTVEEVKSVAPIYLEFGEWKNPKTHEFRNIFVFGFNPEHNVFKMPGVQQNINAIKTPDVVLFDKASRKEFGPIADELERKENINVEVGGRRINVGGVFELGASFGADGNVITSDQNFLRLFKNQNRNLELIDIGLISLKPGADINVVIEKLRKLLPEDVKVMTKQEYIDLEKLYWQNNTSIGFIFNLGTIIGFIVGTVIVYQILYTEVSDHLSEYATLKAMGYTHTYLLSVVFQEALILAIIGFIPGLAFATFQYTLARNATLLPIAMTSSRAVMVLILTILMCFVSGAIAVNKLRSADPADIF